MLGADMMGAGSAYACARSGTRVDLKDATALRALGLPGGRGGAR
ncbi:hypothetical protein [Streptomyces albicerus]|nr:hypothetical protein [Streptomyces albicerus]